MLFAQIAAAVAITGLAHSVGASPVLSSPVSSSSSIKRHVPTSHVLHERHEPQAAALWTKRSKVPSSALLPVRIGLKQGNIEAGHDRLLAISDKTSPYYRKHMSAEEVIDFFAPPQSLVDAVAEWVASSGIARERISHSTNKQWLQFDATTKQVEDLLYAEFHVYQHADGFEDVSTEAYHVPAHIKEHIDYITPGTRLRAMKRSQSEIKKAQAEKRAGDFNLQRMRPKPLFLTSLKGSPTPFVINATSCGTSIVADCLRKQYGITKLQGPAHPGNELGVFESLDDHYSKHDLDVYFSTLYPGVIPNGTYPIEKTIDGAVGAVEEASAGLPIPEAGLESMLDFDAALPLIYPQKSVLFQTDDEWYEQNQITNTTKYFGFYNTFLDAIDGSYCSYQGGNCKTEDCLDPSYPDNNSPLGYKGYLQCGVYKPTNVITISYGSSGLPDNYIRRQCHEVMKLGLQGVTVVSSSGDDGVGRPGFCAPGAAGQGVFYTDMLAECPYTLAVGSTELNNPKSSGYPTSPGGFQKLDEIATTRFASGGGFSNVFEAPEWQRAAISKYFAQNPASKLGFDGYDKPVVNSNFSTVPANQRYYKHGRGYPDIAAVGDRQVVYAGGLWYHVGGTSLSSPVVASMITLVNEERIRKGKGPVGFFTPALYAHSSVLQDVTVGANPGCNTGGFPTAPGWDPATGWGSPIFPKFSALLQSL